MKLKVGDPVERLDGRFYVPIIRTEPQMGLSDTVCRVASDAFGTLKEAVTFASMFILSYTRLTHLPRNGVGDEVLMANLQQVDDFNWSKQAYGEDVVMGKRYQALRFIEEACELVQALGLAPEDIAMVAGDVYSKPAGQRDIEIGDVQITLNILAMTQFRSVAECRLKCHEKLALRSPEELKTKDQAKMSRGLI